MHAYEVEIKVLLGNPEAKDAFMKRVSESFPGLSHSYSESQKNHYFEGGNLLHLFGTFREYISPEEATSLHTLSKEAKSFSVRTRGTPTQTIIVVKATVNDETSSNGTARIEWEVDLAPMTLEEMDAKVLQAGFSYQAKWSREREGYTFMASNKDFMYSQYSNPPTIEKHDVTTKLSPTTEVTLCLDKNAGYGYLAEFEMVIEDAEKVESVRKFLLEIIQSLGYAELDQARLARMFDFYNKNWNDYYGTEKVFTLE